jgi:HEAT repeat protein
MTKGIRFPGFERCLKMMRHSGEVSEEGFGLLLPHAAKYLPQLIAAFWDDDNAGIRDWLVELVGEAKSPAAMPFLIERLDDDDESVRDMAVSMLRKLNTKEARTVLWQKGLVE